MSRHRRGDHRGGRIRRQNTEPVHREPTETEWALVRQGADTWWEHTPCRRTFQRSVDRSRHEETCQP